MAPLAGSKVVQYHELYNYFLKRFGLESIGNIEPLPGVNPGSRHTMELIDRMKTEGVNRITSYNVCYTKLLRAQRRFGLNHAGKLSARGLAV